MLTVTVTVSAVRHIAKSLKIYQMPTNWCHNFYNPYSGTAVRLHIVTARLLLLVTDSETCIHGNTQMTTKNNTRIEHELVVDVVDNTFTINCKEIGTMMREKTEIRT
jgi:hypothetical protein